LTEAEATIQRTFVSTSGNDANPCTRIDPCRNFAAAIANTTAGGEVVALDSGGYGVFSIDKAITIAGAPGAHVAVTAFAGTGITVNVSGPDTVVLRNLYLTGLGGDDGIFFQGGGRLFVESVVASGFTQRGLYANASGAALFVRDSVFPQQQPRPGRRRVPANGDRRQPRRSKRRHRLLAQQRRPWQHQRVRRHAQRKLRLRVHVRLGVRGLRLALRRERERRRGRSPRH
jgi:hypothetical protein